ncbi:ATP-dependent sacrificial sulfur transferase LarE [Propionibacteriaceae bacterium Y2011]
MTSSTEQTQAPPTERLLAELAELPGVVVAFSGGADSALVLAAAVRALGADRVVAATAVSSSLPMVERGPAAAFSASLGVTHHWLDTHEMDRDGYRANSGARCYFCKAELLEVLGELGRELGWPVATGTNADDAVAGFRPGIRAAAERGAITPLLSAGFDKEQVRAVSHDWQLPTWDKPAAACLSSRIAYGIGITPARLARVERAEAAVRAHWGAQAPLADLRVRDLGEGRARLEVDRPALEAFERGAWAEPVLTGIRDAGFDQVEVRAFRSGSMNDALRSRGGDPAPS